MLRELVVLTEKDKKWQQKKTRKNQRELSKRAVIYLRKGVTVLVDGDSHSGCGMPRAACVVPSYSLSRR